MYIWLFSRSVGAGSATTRNTRGLTRSVIALMVPPFPAPSRPSKRLQTLPPLAFTHPCSLTSSTSSLRISRSWGLRSSSSVEASGPGATFGALVLPLLLVLSAVLALLAGLIFLFLLGHHCPGSRRPGEPSAFVGSSISVLVMSGIAASPRHVD